MKTWMYAVFYIFVSLGCKHTTSTSVNNNSLYPISSTHDFSVRPIGCGPGVLCEFVEFRVSFHDSHDLLTALPSISVNEEIWTELLNSYQEIVSGPIVFGKQNQNAKLDVKLNLSFTENDLSPVSSKYKNEFSLFIHASLFRVSRFFVEFNNQTIPLVWDGDIRTTIIPREIELTKHIYIRP